MSNDEKREMARLHKKWLLGKATKKEIARAMQLDRKSRLGTPTGV
jgi:hypothetical protein